MSLAPTRLAITSATVYPVVSFGRFLLLGCGSAASGTPGDMGPNRTLWPTVRATSEIASFRSGWPTRDPFVVALRQYTNGDRDGGDRVHVQRIGLANSVAGQGITRPTPATY
jgi:hypothetical protein